MIAQAARILAQSRDTLLSDSVGVLLLVGLTVGLFHLPGLI